MKKNRTLIKLLLIEIMLVSACLPSTVESANPVQPESNHAIVIGEQNPPNFNGYLTVGSHDPVMFNTCVVMNEVDDDVCDSNDIALEGVVVMNQFSEANPKPGDTLENKSISTSDENGVVTVNSEKQGLNFYLAPFELKVSLPDGEVVNVCQKDMKPPVDSKGSIIYGERYCRFPGEVQA